MGRWRPPQPAASPYITAAGFAALQEELQALWPRRRDVVAALSAAAAEGDRSENAEYIYRKKELAGIDRRIRYLQKRLPVLNVVPDRTATDAIYFGARIVVSDASGRQQRLRIVGADEAEAARGRISVDSPVAQALLKKRVGDTVVVTGADASRELTVEAIDYGCKQQE